MEPLTESPPAWAADASVLAADARPDADGIVRARPLPRDRRPAARLNRWPVAARLYEPLWRGRSLALLTFGAFGTRRELERMVDGLDVGPEGRVLDVGCGAGFYLRALHEARPSAVLHGVDTSEAFLREARRRLARAGVPATLALADAADLPYRDGAFDALACGGTPNELRDRPAAWREMARVTRPGGRVWLMAAVRASSWAGRVAQAALGVGGIATPDAATLLDEAEAAGLRTLRAEHRPPLLLAVLERPAD